MMGMQKAGPLPGGERMQEMGDGDVKKAEQACCTVLCDFFDNLIKCTKKQERNYIFSNFLSIIILRD